MGTHNLPTQTTSFIGRTQEVADIDNLMRNDNCRLLTLVGLGGIGKTRLAIEVARNQLPDFYDGIYFISLKELTSTENIAPKIANILGLQLHSSASPEEQLLIALSEKQFLLVMDNFEHLLEGADLLTKIIRNAPKVKFLVTSRESLNVALEWIHHVTGLDFPADDHSAIENYSAVELFMERARQIRSDFSLEDEHQCVVKVCRLVEGMPLGIELATGWLKSLSCYEIATAIEHNLDVLTSNLRDIPDRHRSLRAVFDHSWRRLSEDEQSTLMKFAVFQGGCTREAADVIAHASMFTLANLVDKSLLRVNSEGRYDIHELLRQYVQELLIAKALDGATYDAHCTYYLKKLHELEPDIKGRRQVEALNEIASDIENIRHAWTWAIDHTYYDLINGSLECLRLFYHMRNHWLERFQQFQHAVETLAPKPDEAPHPTWFRLMTRHTSYTSFVTSPEEVAHAKKNLEAARQFGNPEDEAYCLLTLSNVIRRNQVSEGALAYAEQALAIYQRLGDKFNCRLAYIGIANSYRANGKVDECIRYLKQGEKVARECGDKEGIARALSLLGYYSFDKIGNYKECEQYLQEAYAIRQELNSIDGVAMNAAFLSKTAILVADIDRAETLAHEALITGTDYGWQQSRPVAVIVLGLCEISRENYDEARRLFELIEAKVSFNWDRLLFNIGSALVNCALNDFQSAKKRLLIAIGLFNGMLAPEFRMQLLPPAALILAAEGKPAQAVELLGLAFDNPESLAMMMRDWTLLTKRIVELEETLGTPNYASAWNHGAKQDIDTVVARLAAQFATDYDEYATNLAPTDLIELLTERELEILHLISEGLSNREIARRLTVTLGTVKKHNNNIFGKLHVETRTQAVARGRDLRLIP